MMHPFASQVRLLFMEHIRMPAYLMSSIGFPTIFFLVFAVPESKTAPVANILLASFLGFAVLGVMFLQFAGGLAEERGGRWYQYVRTLPIAGWSFFASRILVAWMLAMVTAVFLTAVGHWTTPVELTLERWVRIYFTLSAAGFCFALMGMALGVWVSERVALPLGNLIYLPMTYAGGLWKPPSMLPESIQSISKYLPTRALGDLLWAAVENEPAPTSAVLRLLIWGGVFSVIATVGYHYRLERVG